MVALSGRPVGMVLRLSALNSVSVLGNFMAEMPQNKRKYICIFAALCGDKVD